MIIRFLYYGVKSKVHEFCNRSDDLLTKECTQSTGVIFSVFNTSRQSEFFSVSRIVGHDVINGELIVV